MKHFFLLLLLSLSSAVLAQTSDRVKEIRSLYSKTQQALREASDEQVTNWSVKTTMRRNESGVGVVTYEIEYYPLFHLGCGEFVRGKRYSLPEMPEYFEILYDTNGPVFYFEKATDYEGTVTECRIYWDSDGMMEKYQLQRVVDGKKEFMDSDGESQWYHSKRAYCFALQEAERGSWGYNTDFAGVAAPCQIPVQTRSGVIKQVTDIYYTYLAPGMPLEDEDAELVGLGKMYRYVTDEFNTTYCTCVSKSCSIGEAFVAYDIWTNMVDQLPTGIVGLSLLDYSDTQALVSVQVEMKTVVREVRLQMIYDAEANKWKVADFISPDNGSSYMKMMQKFLAE